MGIKGLLQALSFLSERRNVKSYAGHSVAIDASCWLHRAAYGHARAVVLGEPTDRYLRFCAQRIAMMKHNGVNPIVVFDGADFPLKNVEADRRRAARTSARERAMELHREGKTSEAETWFQRAISVTTDMKRRWARQLCNDGIDFIFAPYEADAQMAALVRSGRCIACVTEDSDLLAYGCPILTKMDRYGNGISFDIKAWRAAGAPSPDGLRVADAMREVRGKGFLEACILAGCDYLKSIHGVAFKTAIQSIKAHGGSEDVLKLHRDRGDLPDDYPGNFARALLAFQHHFVFDPAGPAKGRPIMTYLSASSSDSTPPDPNTDVSFLGRKYPDAIATQVCAGKTDPVTLQRYPPLRALPRRTQSFGGASSRGVTGPRVGFGAIVSGRQSTSRRAAASRKRSMPSSWARNTRSRNASASRKKSPVATKHGSGALQRAFQRQRAAAKAKAKSPMDNTVEKGPTPAKTPARKRAKPAGDVSDILNQLIGSPSDGLGDEAAFAGAPPASKPAVRATSPPPGLSTDASSFGAFRINTAKTASNGHNAHNSKAPAPLAEKLKTSRTGSTPRRANATRGLVSVASFFTRRPASR